MIQNDIGKILVVVTLFSPIAHAAKILKTASLITSRFEKDFPTVRLPDGRKVELHSNFLHIPGSLNTGPMELPLGFAETANQVRHIEVDEVTGTLTIQVTDLQNPQPMKLVMQSDGTIRSIDGAIPGTNSRYAVETLSADPSNGYKKVRLIVTDSENPQLRRYLNLQLAREIDLINVSHIGQTTTVYLRANGREYVHHLPRPALGSDLRITVNESDLNYVSRQLEQIQQTIRMQERGLK